MKNITIFLKYILTGCIVYMLLSFAFQSFGFTDADGDTHWVFQCISIMLAGVYCMSRTNDIVGLEPLKEKKRKRDLKIPPPTDMLREQDATEDGNDVDNDSPNGREGAARVSPPPRRNEMLTLRQYLDIRDAVINLYNCGKSFNRTRNFRQYLASIFTPTDGLRGVVDADDSEFYANTFTGKDIVSCFRYVGLPVTVDFNTREGQALAHAVNVWNDLLYDDNHQHEKDYPFFISMMTEDSCATQRSSMNLDVELYADSFVSIRRDDSIDDFELFAILWNIDKEKARTYKKLLVKLAAIAAGLNGRCSTQAWTWLKECDEGNDQTDVGSKHSAAGEQEKSWDRQKASALEQLNQLIGLESVKRDVGLLLNYIDMKQKRDQMGMKSPEISYHCVFTGNPGTGKTTVARILAEVYREKGILKKGHLVETDRSGLIAEYVGQTAVKTNKIIDKALDGVLFIDEAYTLVTGSKEDFGSEAIATLLKRMEDNRNRLVVILAGYPENMELFINSNPGLRSRFNRYIHFDDYSAEELFSILNLIASKNEYTFSEETSKYLMDKLQHVVEKREKDFGNGRYVRNIFEKAVQQQASRLASIPEPDKKTLAELAVDDFEHIL